MKRLLFFTFLLLFLGCSTYELEVEVEKPQTREEIPIPPYKTFTLDNGLKVVLMEYHRLPLVEMQMTIGGGTSIDPDMLVGLASMTAKLLRQGTTTRSATQIAEQVDFLGASLNTGSNEDYFFISSEFLRRDIDKGIELFSDVILHPTFPQEEINRERSQRFASLEQVKEDPQLAADLYIDKLIYGDHPYGHQTIGTHSSLIRITQETLGSFYNTTFVPNNALLVVVGDFSTDKMLSKIKQTFDEWRKGVAPAFPTEKPKFFKGRRVVLVNKPDVTQTQICIGNVGIDIKNPDRFAINVANTIFGNGFTSRLVNEIRVKRSLTYDVQSSFSANSLGGSYLIKTFTKNNSVRTTIDVALEETKQLRTNGISEKELKKAKSYIAGNFVRSLQAPENLVVYLSSSLFYGLPENYLQTYLKKIDIVTLDDVKRVVNKYFQYDDLVIMVVTNPGETKSQLEGLGPMEEIPIEKIVE
jgi:predicted Zn-dependent peptidase